MLIVIAWDVVRMKLTVWWVCRIRTSHRLHAVIPVAVVIIVVGACCQTFNLKRFRNRHEWLELRLLHIHFTLIHKLQELRHYWVSHILENNWESGRSTQLILQLLSLNLFWFKFISFAFLFWLNFVESTVLQNSRLIFYAPQTNIFIFQVTNRSVATVIRSILLSKTRV